MHFGNGATIVCALSFLPLDRRVAFVAWQANGVERF